MSIQNNCLDMQAEMCLFCRAIWGDWIMTAKILVVDDDASIRDMLVKMLAPQGYELITAMNGIEALQRVAIEKPDLVLLDVSMGPGPDGYEVCKKIKSDDETALIPVTFLTAQDAPADRLQGVDVGADDYLTKPVDRDLLLARVRSQLRSKQRIDQLESVESVMFSLARTIEAKDHYAVGHLKRMALYSDQLARAAGVDSSHLLTIRYGAILRDVGKLRIDESILIKAGALTPTEFAEIKRHPQYGADIIAHLRTAPKLTPIVLHHHEQWDGWGYPNGLHGEQIPIAARIVSIIEAYEAMTTKRPYRQALQQGEALRRLRARSGTQWDPNLIALFCDLVEKDKLQLPDEKPQDTHARSVS
jgi:putative two-component system response regulator